MSTIEKHTYCPNCGDYYEAKLAEAARKQVECSKCGSEFKNIEYDTAPREPYEGEKARYMVLTDDQFVKVPNRGNKNSEENDTFRKSYQKDAIKRTRQQFQALADTKVNLSDMTGDN